MRVRKYDPVKIGRGAPVDPARCAAYVWRTWSGAQCNKARRADTRDGEWCGQHCPDRNEKREAAKRAARMAKRERQHAEEIARVRAPYEAAGAAALEVLFDQPLEVRRAVEARIGELADAAAASEVGEPWWRD